MANLRAKLFGFNAQCTALVICLAVWAISLWANHQDAGLYGALTLLVLFAMIMIEFALPADFELARPGRRRKASQPDQERVVVATAAQPTNGVKQLPVTVDGVTVGVRVAKDRKNCPYRAWANFRGVTITARGETESCAISSWCDKASGGNI